MMQNKTKSFVTMGTKSKANSRSYSHYTTVRQKLDELGYNSYLSNESLVLVDTLLSDLLHVRKLYDGTQELVTNLNREVQNKMSSVHLSGVNNDVHEKTSQYLEQVLLSERKTNAANIQDLKIENSKLLEKIEDMKFVLDQNSATIKKLNEENFSKSQLILHLQSGIPLNACYSKYNSNIEKKNDLPHSNLSKIQSLYNKILSASENPAIVDWVKASELKITNLERDLECTKKALQASQKMCEEYQKQVLEYDKKTALLSSKVNSKGVHNVTLLKIEMEKMEQENKNLKFELSEAIRKQHEAMSRAIMLAGSQNRDTTQTKSTAILQSDKKIIGLESERNVLKQMLASTQKERDDLMKEVQRLHSQETTLMHEIHSLVSEHPKTESVKTKSLNFHHLDQKQDMVESVEKRDGDRRSRDNWLQRLTEQRQLYYNNVQELVNFTRHRQQIQQQVQQRVQQRVQQQSEQQSEQQSGQPLKEPSPQQRDKTLSERNVEHCATQTDNVEEESRVQMKDAQVPPNDAASSYPANEELRNLSDGQFKIWARSLMEERKLLKEQNEALRSRCNQLSEQLERLEAKLNSSVEKICKAENTNAQLDNDLEVLKSKLLSTERELIQERTRGQQLRLEMGDADDNVASLTKKLTEKCTQLESCRQHGSELEDQMLKLEEQIGSLQSQLRNLQVNKSQKETEHRQHLDEIDSCNARIGQLEKQLSMKQDTVTLLQNNIQAYESRIHFLEQDVNEKQSQTELNRRKVQRLSEEVDKANCNNSALRLENERLVSSMAGLHVDLERERQEAEDLRREMQSYVGRVRQVEAVLAQKDDERELLLKQFQALANETGSFDSEREKMERTLHSQQQQTSALQKELTQVRRRLGEIEQLYTQQRSAGVESEVQADDLVRRLGVLERDLRDARDDKMRLEQQLSAANGLQQRLEKQLERLRFEAAQTDSQAHMMELESTRLQDDMNIMEQRLSKEKESVRSLESIVSILRQERAQQENELRSSFLDLSRLQQREILLQEELANSKAELCSSEGRASDLSREVQRLKQEVLQEKFEREKNRQEFKRINSLSHTSPAYTSPTATPFNSSPAPVPSAHQPSTSDCSQSTRKRISVAARFCQTDA